MGNAIYEIIICSILGSKRQETFPSMDGNLLEITRAQSEGFQGWRRHRWIHAKICLIARFMGPIWGPSGANRTQVGPMLAPSYLGYKGSIAQFFTQMLGKPFEKSEARKWNPQNMNISFLAWQPQWWAHVWNIKWFCQHELVQMPRNPSCNQSGLNTTL